MSYYIHGSTLKHINFIVVLFVCLFVVFFQKCRIIIIYDFRRAKKKNRYERMRGERREKEREGERGR